MNPNRPTFDPEAEDRAALWAARLDGSALSEPERDALNEWLEKDPARADLLAGYRQLGVDLEALLPELAEAGRLPAPEDRAAAPPRRGMLLFWGGAVAAAAAAVLWLAPPGGRAERIETTSSQRKVFTLADGTRVELNANTRILVESGAAERRVRLADGEAYFEVTKDKSRPFVVETPAGSVRVTGTRFDVRTQASSELDVTVVEGSVQVRPGPSGGTGGPIVLGPGDRLAASDGKVALQALAAGALEDALAWRGGWIVLDGTPLSDAFAQFARYHGRSITVSAGASGIRIGGRMSLDNLDGFFSFVENNFPQVRVERDPAGGARVSLRSEN
jgi:transmembrane sensor